MKKTLEPTLLSAPRACPAEVIKSATTPDKPQIPPTALTASDADDRSSKQLLDRARLNEVIKELSVVCPWRAVWAIAVQWFVIAIAISGAVWSHHWLGYVVAMVVIATRQHALGVIAHDGAHFRLFRTRWLNNMVSDLCCAFPIGISTGVFRQFHFDHHRYVNTSQDSEIRYLHLGEDWVFPKLPWECAKLLVQDLLGINSSFLGRLLWWWSPWSRLIRPKTLRYTISTTERLLLIVFGGLVALFLTLTHAWLTFLLLWVLPFMTVFMFINRVRSLGEHYGVEKEHELNATRYVESAWWEKLLIAPCNVNYHLEHHLFPSVPFFNLPRLHQRLMQEEIFRQRAHLTDGYLGIAQGVLSEVSGDPRQTQQVTAS